MSYGFYIDMTSCTGCRTCQIACKDKNDLEIGYLFRRVETYEAGAFPKPGLFHLSRTCNHCADPACVAACPAGAMTKDEATGIVMHDDEACIGCQACVAACPYEIPQYFPERSVTGKCDMCQDLLAQGENPACVDACMMRCLEWGDIDELRAKHPEAVSDMSVLPDSGATGPAAIYTLRDACTVEGAVRKYI